MKKALKVVFKILLIPYLIIVIFLTTCLLNYNEYKITEFGDKTLIIVKDDELAPKFKKGDLVVVEKNPLKDIKVNDDIFFYETYAAEMSINLGKVQNKVDVTKTESTFTMSGDYDLSSQYVIGKADTSSVYSGMGSVLSFFESKYGFLFIVVLPILVAFLYEIYAVYKEVKTDIRVSKRRKSKSEE